jgi:hypothetical protein
VGLGGCAARREQPESGEADMGATIRLHGAGFRRCGFHGRPPKRPRQVGRSLVARALFRIAGPLPGLEPLAPTVDYAGYGAAGGRCLVLTTRTRWSCGAISIGVAAGSGAGYAKAAALLDSAKAMR